MNEQKYKRLCKTIISAVPEIKKREKKNSGLEVCPKCGADAFGSSDKDFCDECDWEVYHTEKITLCDVLRACDEILGRDSIIAVTHRGKIMQDMIFQCYWFFEKNSLSEQSDETKKLLFDLLYT